MDPLQHKYPYYTPYQYAGNKPVTFIDLDGLEAYIPGPDGAEAARARAKEANYNKKEMAHVDKIMGTVTIKDLGGKPLTRMEAYDMFHEAKAALEKGLFIKGNYEDGFEFDSDAWGKVWKSNYMAQKGLSLEQFNNPKDRNTQQKDYYEAKSAAKLAANQIITNSPFFTLFPKETRVYMGNSEDTSTDWGKYGGILDWVGIGFEGVGYVVLWIPGGQIVGGALVGIGKVAGVAGTALEVYDAIEKDKNEDAGVIVVIGVVSSATSVPVNKGIQKGILNNLDRAVIETNKNTTLELTENELTK